MGFKIRIFQSAVLKTGWSQIKPSKGDNISMCSAESVHLKTKSQSASYDMGFSEVRSDCVGL